MCWLICIGEKKIKPKELFRGTFFSLFSNGTIGCSDGVGYIGTLEEQEVDDLYEALKKYKEQKE